MISNEKNKVKVKQDRVKERNKVTGKAFSS
jgi:hypothetical protein